MITNYKKLKIWRMSFDLTLLFYKVISKLPISETKNMMDQIRRAATSLPLNIAEGASSRSKKVFINHLGYAYASGQELEVLLMLCYKLDYVQKDFFSFLSEELDRFKRAVYKFTMNIEKQIVDDRMKFLDNKK